MAQSEKRVRFTAYALIMKMISQVKAVHAEQCQVCSPLVNLRRPPIDMHPCRLWGTSASRVTVKTNRLRPSFVHWSRD